MLDATHPQHDVVRLVLCVHSQMLLLPLLQLLLLRHLLLALLMLNLTSRHLNITGNATALSPAQTNTEATRTQGFHVFTNNIHPWGNLAVQQIKQGR